jgi:hypothetical protein
MNHRTAKKVKGRSLPIDVAATPTTMPTGTLPISVANRSEIDGL